MDRFSAVGDDGREKYDVVLLLLWRDVGGDGSGLGSGEGWGRAWRQDE
jgi:hypothetical protein